MKKTVDATVVRGYGVASKNLKFQKPELVKQLPEIKDIHLGSINLRLDVPLYIAKYDYTTSPIRWWDAGPDQWQMEIFGFQRIEFEYPLNGARYRAWIFDCHNSSYHRDPLCFEVVAQPISGVSPYQRCRIHMP